jgi:hypothetical protein
MFVTDSEVKLFFTIYLILFCISILLIVYTDRYASKDKIIRLLVAVFIPVLGIALIILEGFITLLRKFVINDKSNLSTTKD